jgi:predicted kinase
MIYIVTGPPCVGKSTWVNERAKQGNFVIDLDRIALSISSQDTPHHEYPKHIRAAAISMRKAAVAHALNYGRSGDSYIIHAKPPTRARAQYKKLGAVFVDLSAPLAALMERAKNERPEWVAAMIPRWYEEPEQE